MYRNSSVPLLTVRLRQAPVSPRSFNLDFKEASKQAASSFHKPTHARRTHASATVYIYYIYITNQPSSTDLICKNSSYKTAAAAQSPSHRLIASNRQK